MNKPLKTKKNNKGLKNSKNSFKIIDTKLKPVMPTLRQKKRFIRIQIEEGKKFDFKFLSNNLTEQIIYFLGAIEFSNSGVWFLMDKFNFEKQEMIIKVSTKSKDKLVGALSLITKLGNEDVRIKTLRVSGTLKGVYKE